MTCAERRWRVDHWPPPRLPLPDARWPVRRADRVGEGQRNPQSSDPSVSVERHRRAGRRPLVTDPGYWAQHMCQPVQFATAAGVLLADEELAVVEIGPGQSLGALLRSAGCPPQRWPLITSTLRSGSDPRPADQVLTECLGRLWLIGVDLDWEAYHGRRGAIEVYPGGAPGRVPLPTYPFQRQRYWIDPRPPQVRPTATAGEPTTLEEMASLPRLPEESWLSVPLWRQAPAPPPARASGRDGWYTPVTSTSPVLEELRHRLPQLSITVVCPGTGYACTLIGSPSGPPRSATPSPCCANCVGVTGHRPG